MSIDDIKVGDYVRTEDGDIGKIKENGGEVIEYCVGTLYGIDLDRNCLDREVLKSSSNIIDLIEVGDYVNGEKIIETSIDHCGRKILIYGYDNGDRQVAITIYKEDIKSIVTKECFKSMEYKIEK